MEDDTPFIIERPNSPGKVDGKIRLGPVAIAQAQEYGMSLEEFANYLLNQAAQREAGVIQKVGEN